MSIQKIVCLPLVLPYVAANMILEAITGRIPTDIDLVRSSLMLEAENELLRTENHILRTELSAKVSEIMRRVNDGN